MYTVMHCAICQKNFATKYTYERHIQKKHRPEEEMEDQESDNDKPDIFEYSQSGNESSGESMEQTDNGSETEEEEEEEPDFWTMLIRYVVLLVHDEQKANGTPGFTSLQQITEKPVLSKVINQLRYEYDNIKRIYEAGSSDSLLEKIENELEKLKEESTNEEFEEEAQEMAWKKYKPCIKKKILQNLKEFEKLVCNSDADNEEDSD